jgi:hypothetical protein
MALALRFEMNNIGIIKPFSSIRLFRLFSSNTSVYGAYFRDLYLPWNAYKMSAPARGIVTYSTNLFNI